MKIPSESKEYLRALVRSQADPTGLVVEFALPPLGTDPTTWVVGEWEGPSESLGGLYNATARVLIGAGTALANAEGSFSAFVRVQASPEAPVRYLGRVTIT